MEQMTGWQFVQKAAQDSSKNRVEDVITWHDVPKKIMGLWTELFSWQSQVCSLLPPMSWGQINVTSLTTASFLILLYFKEPLAEVHGYFPARDREVINSS